MNVFTKAESGLKPWVLNPGIFRGRKDILEGTQIPK